jgi:hypothetical protein
LYPDRFGEVKMVEPAINHKTILFHHTLSYGAGTICVEACRLLKDARSLAPLDSKTETSPPALCVRETWMIRVSQSVAAKYA